MSAGSECHREDFFFHQRGLRHALRQRPKSAPANSRAARRRRKPVSFPFERIGGQSYFSALSRRAAPLVELRPVEIQATNEHLADAVEHLRPVATLGMQTRQPCEAAGGKRLPAQSAENRVWAGFKEYTATHVGSGADAAGEPYRFADMADPIAGIENFVACLASRHVRDQPQCRFVKRNRSRHFGELVQHRLHQRRVKRMRNGQFAGRNSFRAKPRYQRLGRAALSGDDGLRRAVDRRDRYSMRHPVEQGQHPILRRLYGINRPISFHQSFQRKRFRIKRVAG